MHKASDAGHIEPHGICHCLSFSYRGCAACRRPSPGGTKTAYFWRVLDVHKTSQIPSKMALGRGLFGARGGISKKLNTRGKLIFEWFFDNFWCCIFWCKNWGTCKKHRKYRQKMTPRTRLELQKLPCFWLSIYLKIYDVEGLGFGKPKISIFGLFGATTIVACALEHRRFCEAHQ